MGMMTKQQMADFVASEMLEEIAELQRRFAIFQDRFLKFEHMAEFMSESKKRELRAAVKAFQEMADEES